MSGPVAKTLNPSLFGLRLSMLLHLCRARLRAHPVAELLTAVGVAVGVALVFGVLLANASLTGSAAKLVTGLAGGARIELAAPSPQGFDQRIAEQAGELPGVEVAAPVLRRNVTLSGPRGSEQVQLVGVTPSLEALGGIATQELAAGAQLQRGGLGLPASVAQAIGAGRRARVMIASGAQQRSVQVRALLGSRIASLASSPIAVAVLGLAQRLTYGTGEVTGGAGRVAGGAGQVTGSSGQVAGGSGRVAGGPGRVTEVLVKPLRGHGAQVAGELRHLAGDRLLVRPATAELGMLSLATAPSRQSTALFTAIAVMIGFLLALNATLLTAPERRRFIAELLTQGYETRQVALLLGFQALIVGLIASLAGIVLGALLASALFTHVPGFLSAAFPLGTEEAIAPAAVLAALACGLLASAGASLTALLDPWHARATPDLALQRAALSETVRTESVLRLAGAGLLLLFVAVGLALLMSSLTIVGGVMLALATVCLAPALQVGMVHGLPRLAERLRSPALIVAFSELQAITTRALALSAIVALAVYGGIAIGGARRDLLAGIRQASVQYFGTVPVWVSAGRDVFNTNSFSPKGPAAAISRAQGVAHVRVYRGGLLDVGQRRLWVRARPAADGAPLEPSQLVQGEIVTATKRIDDGGWAAVSSAFAAESSLRLGGAFWLRTPTGRRRLRVAAITTNSGWPSGTITIDSAQYASWWGGSDAAALEVSLKAGVSPAAGALAVMAALRPYPGLDVYTAAQRVALSDGSAREGLRTLSEISTMLLLAASLSVACALTATIWQRRPRLAALKMHGYGHGQLWGAVLVESAASILGGCALGALLGVGGHALASRFVRSAAGFPVSFSLGPAQALLTVALFCAVAMAVIALPGAAATAVPPRMALQE